jgi:hypothetical protein
MAVRETRIRNARVRYEGAQAAWRAALALCARSGATSDYARALALGGRLDEAAEAFLRALGEVT